MKPVERLPAKGDVVLYYPSTVLVGVLPDSQPAIITLVHPPWPDTPLHVALQVFGHPENVIHRAVPFSAEPKGGCWTWRK